MSYGEKIDIELVFLFFFFFSVFYLNEFSKLFTGETVEISSYEGSLRKELEAFVFNVLVDMFKGRLSFSFFSVHLIGLLLNLDLTELIRPSLTLVGIYYADELIFRACSLDIVFC